MRGTKEELLRAAQEFGLEGLVAKRPSSTYESGRRGGAWVKFKISRAQEFVIAGYTLPEGDANISTRCLSATTVRMDSGSPAESARAFLTRSWRTSTPSSRSLAARLPLHKTAGEIKRQM